MFGRDSALQTLQRRCSAAPTGTGGSRKGELQDHGRNAFDLDPGWSEPLAFEVLFGNNTDA
jgi:hypothetical protein